MQYFSIRNYEEWAYNNYIDEKYIYDIDKKKLQIMESLNLSYKMSFPYNFKTNLLNYENINYMEIIETIKSHMIDIYGDNIYYKSHDNDYSFINHKNSISRGVISNTIECSVYSGKPKYYLFSFKTQKKGENFYVLDKIMNINDAFE
jgi:hypothetical protein